MVYVAFVVVGGAVTRTLIVQVPGGLGGVALAGMVPPVKVIVRESTDMDTVPPQVVVADPATADREAPGKVSDMLTPV